jgi:hypothetical protein
MDCDYALLWRNIKHGNQEGFHASGSGIVRIGFQMFDVNAAGQRQVVPAHDVGQFSLPLLEIKAIGSILG